jgi:hypothetical protein
VEQPEAYDISSQIQSIIQNDYLDHIVSNIQNLVNQAKNFESMAADAISALTQNIESASENQTPYFNVSGEVTLGKQAGGKISVGEAQIGARGNFGSKVLLQGSLSQIGNDAAPIDVKGYYYGKNGQTFTTTGFTAGFIDYSNTNNSNNPTIGIDPISYTNDTMSLKLSLDLSAIIGINVSVEFGLKPKW